ncbi:hypothetical protein AGLY_007424 [Aphis glycines]|uniref:Uncharacterized protein n=1 Tax=Aphis glycines TaxID=307491 RepID=A0A6G0TNM8_APHGL|nr:hypothetical protein AGLY_007424 [Aphis glycines]
MEGLFKIINKQSVQFFRSRALTQEVRSNPRDYVDHYWRYKLKALSGYCFPKVFKVGPAYMLFTHLHSLTAKSPFTKQQIYNDIDSWVGEYKEDGTKKDIDRDCSERVLNRIFTEWNNPEGQGFLDFKGYCNDFMRWGTSDGAAKVEIDGSKYRTKWAWEYHHSTERSGLLRHDYDLYKTLY